VRPRGVPSVHANARRTPTRGQYKTDSSARRATQREMNRVSRFGFAGKMCQETCDELRYPHAFVFIHYEYENPAAELTIVNRISECRAVARKLLSSKINNIDTRRSNVSCHSCHTIKALSSIIKPCVTRVSKMHHGIRNLSQFRLILSIA